MVKNNKIEKLQKLLHHYSRFGEGLTTKVLRDKIDFLYDKQCSKSKNNN